jgi:hypothetical protein
MVLEELLHLMRPIHAGALLTHVHRTPPGQGLGAQKHVGWAYPFICVILARGLAGLSGPGLTRFLDPLERLVVHMHHRLGWILGLLIESQALFQVGPKVCTGRRRKHPTLVPVRLERVFCRGWRTGS